MTIPSILGSRNFGSTHDIKRVIVTFGEIRLDSFGDGDSISIDYNSEKWETIMGTGGHFERAKLNDKSAVVTIRLMPNSPQVNLIRASALIDELSGKFAQPLLISDLNSGEVYSSPQAWSQNNISVTMGSSKGFREIMFACGNLVHTSGPIIPATPLG